MAMETVCRRLNLFSLLLKKKKSTCLTQDGTLDWKPVSGTTLRSSHCGLCFSIWTGSLAPAVPQPSPSLAHTSCLHPLSLLGVRFSGDWMQRRMRTSPLPLPCIARIRCPHLIFGKLTVSSWVGDEACGSRSGFF